MPEKVYLKLWTDDNQIDRYAPALELERADKDGMGVSIALDPEQKSGVVIEVFDGKLMIHVWDGEENSMVFGDDPETTVISYDYDGWRKALKEDE